MSNLDKILFELEVSKEKNSDSFIEQIDAKLSNLKKQLKKRIIGCCIELIQNNLKHNSSVANLLIIKDSDTIKVKISQDLNETESNRIIKIIDSINDKSEQELKDIYQSNIKKNNFDKLNTGNGLIYCRIKSKKSIEVNYKGNKLEISLKFDNHENNS